MLRAQPEHLERVRDLRVAGGRRDPTGPFLDLRSFDLDRPTTDPADQVVVMPAGGVGGVDRAAQPVLRLAVRPEHDVDLTGVGERLEVPVDGGQADGLAAPSQLAVQVLCGPEAVGVAQGRVDGSALPGGTQPGAPQRSGGVGGHLTIVACPSRPRLRRMPRLAVFVPLVAATGILLSACGSSGSTADSPTVVAPSGAATGASSAATSTGSQPSPGSTSDAAASATASTAAGGAAGSQPASTPSSGSGAAGRSAGAGQVPLPPPGSYTYRVHGTSRSVLGDQSLNGDSTLTVDQPNGNRERSTQRDRGGSTEQVLVARAHGLYLAEIHLSQQGFDEDFKPTNPVLLFPAGATNGQQWRWRMTSTDGKYTLTARLQLTDTHSSATTTGGQRVDTVSLSSVLHIHSNDVDITIHQHDEADRDAVIVRERAVSDGTAYGTKFHSDATRVLAKRPA
jgi:hypothetical protein